MTKFTTLAFLSLVALTCTTAAPPKSKVAASLQKSLQANNRVNIFISFKAGTHAALASVNSLRIEGDRATAVYKTLVANAAQTQKNVLEMLNSNRFFAIKTTSFWITNQVYVQGADAFLVQQLAAMEEVSEIAEEQIIQLGETHTSEAEPRQPGDLAEWGVEKIDAPAAWAISNGAGAVVGIIDTGARYTHEAIRDSYRGGTHSWFNAFSPTQLPSDGQGHGTHVTGTIAGSQASGIGVAPGAKWISCRGLNDQGQGSQSTLTACGQFMTCPTTYNGGSPNCALHPHVVSNSWGGNGGASWFDPVIDAWHASNIIPVFSNSNDGPECRTTGSPADSRAGVLGVGATDLADGIAVFSSRGPSYFNTLKPDISAPGHPVRSAGHTADNSYVNKSGTSMACPHVAGVVALLKARNANDNYPSIKNKLQSTAERGLSFSGQTCSGIRDSTFPNYTFGYGRVNANRAIRA